MPEPINRLPNDAPSVQAGVNLANALAPRKRTGKIITFPKTGYVTLDIDDKSAEIKFSPRLTDWLEDMEIKYLQIKAEEKNISEDGRIPAFLLECESPDNPLNIPVSMSKVNYFDPWGSQTHPVRLQEAFCGFRMTSPIARIWPAKPTIVHVTQPFNSDRIRVPLNPAVFDRKPKPASIRTPEMSTLLNPRPGFFYTSNNGKNLVRIIHEVIAPAEHATVRNTTVRFNTGPQTPMRECALITFRTWIHRVNASYVETVEDLL